MNNAVKIDDLLALPAAERLAIASAIWDSLVASAEGVPVPGWHREVLEQRLRDDDAEAAGGESWPDLRRRLEGRT